MTEFSPSYSYQYDVVDQGDGTVYKQLMSPEASEAKFETYGRRLVANPKKLGVDVVGRAVASLAGIKNLLEDYPALGPSLANPVIEDNANYSQDKVETLGSALKKESARGQRNLIDQYVDLSLFHVSYGFMETVFKVTANCGVDDDNQVVLIDLGALTFDKQEAVKLARNKRWLRSEAFFYPFSRPDDFAIPFRLKPYFFSRMLTQFSASAIDSTWQNKTQE